MANATRIGLTDVAMQSGAAYGRAFGPICGFDDDDDEVEEREPPAVIVIEQPAAPVIVVENGVRFVTWVIKINNSGGKARGVFLILNLDLLELSDLRFLTGVGYVREIRGKQVIIGIGENNVVDDDDDRNQRRARITYSIEYGNSGGRRFEPVEVVILVPAVVVVPVIVTLPRLTEAEIDTRFRARWVSGGGLRR